MPILPAPELSLSVLAAAAARYPPVGSVMRWRLRVLFPDHDALSEAQEYLQEADVSLTIQAIYEPKDDGHIQYGLTELQRDTFVAAFEADYFEVPRGNSLTDLSEQLEFSHQGLSERLRRATSSLVESILITGDDEIEEE